MCPLGFSFEGACIHSGFGFENGLADYLPELSFDIHRDLVPLDWIGLVLWWA